MKANKIDMTAYPRKEHFDYFRSLAFPYVGITANIDVTKLAAAARSQGDSFFLYLLYSVGRAANGVEEFRQRIEGEEIVLYESCKTSHTVMKPDGTYAYCEADPELPFDEFMSVTSQKQEKAKAGGSIREESDPQSLFFISCLPWLNYTSLIQPVPQPADSNPRITWGKYYEQDGKLFLPVSVLAHHALVDGKQIANFYSILQETVSSDLR